MSDLKHTKGPWKLSDVDGKTIHVDGKIICRLPLRVDEAQEVEANFKLLAAAPELLEALQELLNINPHSVDVLPRINAEKKAALAIQKATT